MNLQLLPFFANSCTYFLFVKKNLVSIPCYLARRSLCEIINSTLGMLIHRWFIDRGGGGGGGTLFRTCIKLKSKQRESGVSQSPCFWQMRSEMRLCLFLQKEMRQRSAHFSNFEWRLYLLALFSANFKPTACRYKIEI